MTVVALGVDVGTTNTKAALVRVRDGVVEVVATATAPTPDDTMALVATVGRVVGEVGAQHPRLRPAVVGIASMAETGVPLDAAGTPMTGLLRWDGHRAGAQAAALASTHGAEVLFTATGVRASAKVPLATWAWLAAEGIRFDRWAGAADLVALALTGRLVTDHTLAGRTMAYRAVPDGPPPSVFDADLLSTVGLRPEQLPAVAAPDAVAGHVVTASGAGGASVAGALRLDPFVRAGTPVVVAGHDHAVGAWAAGARAPGARVDSLGTTEAVFTVLPAAPEPVPVARAGMSWVRTAAGDRHALLAGSSSAGVMLTWLAERVPVDVALAVGAVDDEAGSSGLVVLPYLAGRQTPAPNPAARVEVLAGDRVLDDHEVRALGDRDPIRLTRAVLEGICLHAVWMMAAQAQLGGPPPGGDAAPAKFGTDEPVRILGGAARALGGWAATKRRSMPHTLAWVTVAEPVAAGAALLAAARAGLLGDPADAVLRAPLLAAELTAPAEHPLPAALLPAFVRAATRTPSDVSGEGAGTGGSR